MGQIQIVDLAMEKRSIPLAMLLIQTLLASSDLIFHLVLNTEWGEETLLIG